MADYSSFGSNSAHTSSTSSSEIASMSEMIFHGLVITDSTSNINASLKVKKANEESLSLPAIGKKYKKQKEERLEN